MVTLLDFFDPVLLTLARSFVLWRRFIMLVAFIHFVLIQFSQMETNLTEIFYFLICELLLWKLSTKINVFMPDLILISD
jgi:hypothetical protein